MTRDDLHPLLDFHYWARDHMLDALERLPAEAYTRALDGSFGSIRDTAVHIYAAEELWVRRWQGETVTALRAGDSLADVPALRAAWRELETSMRAFAAGLDDERLNARVHYISLTGKPASNALSHMLHHVVNHATYHRGQVTTLIRQVGADPPKQTDVIAYYRDLEARA